MSTIKIAAFFFILVGFVLLSVTAPLLSTKIYDITVISFIGYFFFELFSIKVFATKVSAGAIVVISFIALLTMHAFTIYTWIFWGVFGLPAVIACSLAVIAAYCFVRRRFPVNLAVPALGIAFITFMYFWGWALWIHRDSYGTFTGRVKPYAMPDGLTGLNEQREEISNANFRNKIVLLDFWTTTCAVCFDKFPRLEAAFERLKDDPSIVILAVDTPIDEDLRDQAFMEIRKRGYTFPVLVLHDPELAQKFGVRFYPTTLVENRVGMVVYKGNIEGAIKMVDELAGQ